MISFIIPAHNEEGYLGAALRAALASAQDSGESCEMVVVDDASTDGTAALAASLDARVIPVNLRKISAVRNAGARAAQGTFLFFVDADTSLNAPVLRAAVAALRQGAVGGGAPARFDGALPAYAKMLVPALNAFSRRLGLAYGCFLFCRADAFQAAGGFDENLYASEEWALSRALRKRGRFVILRESVLTSGRKFRSYSGFEILRIFGALVLGGSKALRRRKGMGMWYDAKR